MNNKKKVAKQQDAIQKGTECFLWNCFAFSAQNVESSLGTAMKCSQKHLLKLNFGHFKHRIFRNPQKSIMKHSCPQSSAKPSWFCIAWTAGSSWNCSFLASRQKESYIGNEQDHLLVQTEQSPCSTNHMWCGWHWGKEGKIICKWEASRLVCIPWMKAVISQMHNSLLPNDRESKKRPQEKSQAVQSHQG